MINKVNTEEEAIKFCKEYNYNIIFDKLIHDDVKGVEVRMGSYLSILGTDLVGTVNKAIELYDGCNNKLRR